jgi:hypothetical protein
VYALGNHPESRAQQRYMHHNTNLKEQAPNAHRHTWWQAIAQVCLAAVAAASLPVSCLLHAACALLCEQSSEMADTCYTC